MNVREDSERHEKYHNVENTSRPIRCVKRREAVVRLSTRSVAVCQKLHIKRRKGKTISDKYLKGEIPQAMQRAAQT